MKIELLPRVKQAAARKGIWHALVPYRRAQQRPGAHGLPRRHVGLPQHGEL